MRNAIFTIVAKNYIGLAQILEKSVRKNADADFYIFVADEFDNAFPESLPPNVFVARKTLGIRNDLWLQMSFKYSLVEFCTAIKPYCFDFLLNHHNHPKVVYFDPDIYVFNSLDTVFSNLEKHSILLTPHIVEMHTLFKGAYQDYLFLVNGTFNLGFMGLKNSGDAQAMLDWWKNRMTDQCFFDNDRGMATDQKWINLLPAFFDREALSISRDRGLNVAPWNYHERKIIQENNRLFVARRDEDNDPVVPLIFMHFSGYDYRAFATNKIVHKNETANTYADLNYAFDEYAKALIDDRFFKYINLTYSYNRFNNGKNILHLHRRLYRRLLDENYNFSDPFEVGENSFYNGLKKRKLIDNSPSSADVVTNKTLPGFNKKVAKVNWLFRIIQRLVGVRRYSIFIRFFRRFFKEENQAFLFDKKIKGRLW